MAGRPRPLLAGAHRLYPRRERAHRAVQLVVRPPRGGTFLLRIEDTDVAHHRRGDRQHPGHPALARSRLGREPVLQSERFDGTSRRSTGCAPPAWRTSASARRTSSSAGTTRAAAGRPRPGYDGRCRDLTPAERAELAAEGRPSVVRFRTPDTGVSRFDDVVRGEVEVEWSTIPDFVIVRSDGTPVFFLANAVDDIDMGITHVIRGEDLIDSTHRVLALRDALGGGPQPVYAHLPLILGADRAKLSKRHGAIAVEEFREQGYLPEALVNYLALFGWAPADGREVLSPDELIAEFDLDASPTRRRCSTRRSSTG